MNENASPKFTCCICHKEFTGYGNDPFPICSPNDNESRCCNDCDNLVTSARLSLHETDEYIRRDEEISKGDKVAIIYSTSSDKPIDVIAQGKLLVGEVKAVATTPYNSTLYAGTWGDYFLNSTTDRFVKIDVPAELIDKQEGDENE